MVSIIDIILLTRDLLPDITQYSDYFTGQQDKASAHRARKTVELLKLETPDFITPWPPNSPDLNPVDYKIWGILQEQVYKTSSKDFGTNYSAVHSHVTATYINLVRNFRSLSLTWR